MTIAEQLESHKGCMTLTKLAAILNISYKTVYKWVRTSHFPAKKIAGSYWVDPIEAARWWNDHSTTIAKSPRPVSRRPRVANVA